MEFASVNLSLWLCMLMVQWWNERMKHLCILGPQLSPILDLWKRFWWSNSPLLSYQNVTWDLKKRLVFELGFCFSILIPKGKQIDVLWESDYCNNPPPLYIFFTARCRSRMKWTEQLRALLRGPWRLHHRALLLTRGLLEKSFQRICIGMIWKVSSWQMVGSP